MAPIAIVEVKREAIDVAGKISQAERHAAGCSPSALHARLNQFAVVVNHPCGLTREQFEKVCLPLAASAISAVAQTAPAGINRIIRDTLQAAKRIAPKEGLSRILPGLSQSDDPCRCL